jgi:tetratricopeptide (TPR) repeat protein
MPDKPFLSRFTPSRTDPDLLERIFVQRHELAKDTVERIHESAVSGNKHHLLFIGPRGSGKTHFVSVVFNRVTLREDLHESLRIAWLGEDETTTSFLDLLLRIYRALQQRYANEFPADALQELYGLPPAPAAKRLGKLLLDNLGGRKLLVIVENMDALCAGLKAAGQKQWRAFIQENAVLTTLATSQQLFEGVSRRDSAFFGFFRTEYLKPLTVEEAVLLLKKIAELSEGSEDKKLAAFLQTPEGRARVRALHHLSGGNHRIYIVLSQFITRETLDELIGPFEKMIDELTPYYQARVKGLSPQQRKLVEFLCTCRDPVPVTQIARSLFMTHQTATGQLKDLREKGYVQSHARGRESLYELTEPLMRMCVEVKENRREPIRLVVDFLRIWCTPEQLRALPTRSSMEQQYIQSAMQAVDRAEEDLRVRSILRDLVDHQRMGKREEQVRTLGELTETRGNADDWVELGDALWRESCHAEALTAYEKALQLDQKSVSAWNGRGMALESLGRPEEALAAYGQTVQLDPKSAYAWSNRGDALGKLGRHEEALAAYGRALQLDPMYDAAWNNRGVALAYLGRYEEALADYDEALRLDPQYAPALTNRGNVLGRLGRHEEALSACDQALELDWKYAHAWNGRGIALADLGRYEEALAAYDQTLQLDPKYAYAWIDRGDALRKLGRYEEALAAYDQALLLDAKYAPTWNNRGVALENLGRYAEALIAYDQARELDPTSAYAWRNRGDALRKLERHEEALAAYDQALELDPKYAHAWNGRGIALANLGRYEEALAAYDQAVQLDPKYAYAWNNRGNVLANLGRHEEALSAYDQALRLDPKHVPARNNRGLALRRLGRHAEALAAHDQALQLDPKAVSAWNGRGVALKNLGRYEEALAAYDQAVQLDPKYAYAWNNRGNVLANLGTHVEALAAYDQAVQLDPKYAYAWNGRGIALENLGRYEEALAAFDQALQSDPNYARAWNNRGDALGKLGRHEEALAAYDRAHALYPAGPAPACSRVGALLLLDRWEAGFAALQQSLKEYPPSLKGHAGDTKALVKIMMAGSLEKAAWQQRISRLVAIYAEAQALTYLGEGLVRSLATLSANMLSAEALAAWHDVWHEAGAGHDQLIIPLRIFAAGIHYLQTKDRRALLDLLTEERKILAEALGIDMEAE